MTKIDRDDFTAAHHQGMHREDLAAHFGISPTAVTKIRRELGLPLDKRRRRTGIPSARKIDRAEIKRLVEDGWTTTDVAERFNCHPSTISRIRHELGIAHSYAGRLVTETRLLAIWQMLFDGWSHKEIHNTEGADVETIRRYFPGTAWTQQQIGEHTASLHRFAPTGFNARPKAYDRTKYASAA